MLVAQEDIVINYNAPEIVFEENVIDLGEFMQYDDPSSRCEFLFTNTGKEPLIISKAKGSCGCTVPEWPKEPIMPGENGVIKVNYDEKRVGSFNKSVTITSNAKNTPASFLNGSTSGCINSLSLARGPDILSNASIYF